MTARMASSGASTGASWVMGAPTAGAGANGVAFARSPFTVGTSGEEVVGGASGEGTLPPFPAPGETVRFAWHQSPQHLEMVSVQTRSVAQSLVQYLTGPGAAGRSPGLLAAILDEEGGRAIAAAGGRTPGSPEQLRSNDLLQIGSSTKALTSTLRAPWGADGPFVPGWQTTIAQGFPEGRAARPPEYRPVTLWQLGRHAGGVPNAGPAWWAWAAPLSSVEGRSRILQENLAAPPGRPLGTFSYSNAGYLVAAAMADKLRGKRWETWMEERLFTLLGMASAGCGAPSTLNEVDQPWEHHRASSGMSIPARVGYDGP